MPYQSEVNGEAKQLCWAFFFLLMMAAILCNDSRLMECGKWGHIVEFGLFCLKTSKAVHYIFFSKLMVHDITTF